jgi:hypothetical protein
LYLRGFLGTDDVHFSIVSRLDGDRLNPPPQPDVCDDRLAVPERRLSETIDQWVLSARSCRSTLRIQRQGPDWMQSLSFGGRTTAIADSCLSQAIQPNARLDALPRNLRSATSGSIAQGSPDEQHRVIKRACDGVHQSANSHHGQASRKGAASTA